ncbi:MAG TPA: YcxB family protein [Candidatus Acidoferrum sp.]|nr:YcxB family protein [Candidatus Acidoferrum sp.]
MAALVIRAAILHSFTPMDTLIAVAWGLGWVVFLSIWVTIRGKTAKRTLTVSAHGISTEIGRIKAQIPWAKIKSVADTSKFVLIARTNGNAFFVPNRAFSSPDLRNEFFAKVTDWSRQAT